MGTINLEELHAHLKSEGFKVSTIYTQSDDDNPNDLPLYAMFITSHDTEEHLQFFKDYMTYINNELNIELESSHRWSDGSGISHILFDKNIEKALSYLKIGNYVLERRAFIYLRLNGEYGLMGAKN